MSIADEAITKLRESAIMLAEHESFTQPAIPMSTAERIVRAALKDVDAGRRLVMAEDIELWDGPTLHGQWTPRVVAVEPRFWQRCGAWLLEGKDADLRALLDGTYVSDDTRLIATLTGELDAARAREAELTEALYEVWRWNDTAGESVGDEEAMWKRAQAVLAAHDERRKAREQKEDRPRA